MPSKEFVTIESVLKSGLCLHCGTCMAVCPLQCIEKSTDKDGNPIPKIGKGCVACSDCVNVCPGLTTNLSPIGKRRESLRSPYLGTFNGTFIGKARSALLRNRKVASGGIVSAVADIFFATHPRGVVQWVTVSKAGKPTTRFLDRTAFLEVDGDSVYIPSFTNQVFADFEKGGDRPILAIGLPCHIQGLRLLEKHNHALSNRIVCRISLFCGLSVSTNALPFLLERAGHSFEDVRDIRFRTKKGVVVTLKSGEQVILNKNIVNYSHIIQRCTLCRDHTGELADISCGDAWLSSFSKKAETPWSVIITRSDAGGHWMRRAVEGKRLWAMRVDAEDVIASQRPMLFFKKRTLGQRYFLNGILGGLNPQYSGPWPEKSFSMRVFLGNLVLLGHLRWRNHKSYMFLLTRVVGLPLFNWGVKFCLYLDVFAFVKKLAGNGRLIHYRGNVLPYQIRWLGTAKRSITDRRRQDMKGFSALCFTDETLSEWEKRYPKITGNIVGRADTFMEGIYIIFGIPYDLNKHGWHGSPETGREYPNFVEPIFGLWFRNRRRYNDFGDEKYAIELNKHYALVELALAFRMTGNKVYAHTLAKSLKAWRDASLPHMGIAWYGNVHVAQRMMAWMMIDLLFQDVGSAGDATRTEISKGMREHVDVLKARFIYPANNHKLGSLCVLVIAFFFQGKPRKNHLRRYLAILSMEIERQITANGAPREGSLAYGYLVFEWLLILNFFALCSKFEMPEIVVSRFKAMVQWFSDFLGPERHLPPIGDISGERALPFSEALCTFDDILFLGKKMLNLPVKDRLGPFAWLLLKTAGIDESESIQADLGDKPRFIDDEAGYARLTGQIEMGRWTVWMRAGAFGLSPKYGHAHSDFLAPVAYLDGKPVLSECGTYKYNVRTEDRLQDVLSYGHSGMRYDLFEQHSWRGTFEWRENSVRAGWVDNKAGLTAWMKMPDEALLTRSIHLDADGLIFEDSLKKNDPSERMLEWSFIFDGDLITETLNHKGTALFRVGHSPDVLIELVQHEPASCGFEIRPVRISTSYGTSHKGCQLIFRRTVAQDGLWSTRIKTLTN